MKKVLYFTICAIVSMSMVSCVGEVEKNLRLAEQLIQEGQVNTSEMQKVREICKQYANDMSNSKYQRWREIDETYLEKADFHSIAEVEDYIWGWDFKSRPPFSFKTCCTSDKDFEVIRYSNRTAIVKVRFETPWSDRSGTRKEYIWETFMVKKDGRTYSYYED